MKTFNLFKIIEIMETWAPLELAAEWDNSGLQIGKKDQEIQKILISLDVDPAVLEKVKTSKYDLVITHHPLIFKPLKQIVVNKDIGEIIDIFIKNDTSLYSAHTNLDAAPGGVNDCLIKAFNFDPGKGRVFSQNLGKWFFNDRCLNLEALRSLHNCNILGAKNKNEIKKIAFACGGGGSLLKELIDLEIDAYITGELGYHDILTCELNNITALCLGHKESEEFILPEIQNRMLKQFPNLEISLS
ncbi:Nif3-like dinuclear metal center hexameric protein [Candidatus Margulisiibacteriota bacterium]